MKIEGIFLSTWFEHQTQYISGVVSNIKVYVAEHNINKDDGEVLHEVACLKIHPGHNSKTLDKDYAVLVLKKKIDFNDNAGAACLPFDDLAETYEGKILTVSWWGRQSSKPLKHSLPDTLHHVDVKGISNAKCKRAHGDSITKFMLCATSSSEKLVDACNGDSAGPLTYNNKGKDTLVGVVSGGIGCGKKKFPGVCSRMTSVKDWISGFDIYKKGEPTCPKN